MACHLCMLTSSLSGSDTWVRSTGIQVGSGHPGEEDAWGASARFDSHLVGACGHVRCPILTLFSLVASSLSPLHSGMVRHNFDNFQFRAKIKQHFKPDEALIPIVGDSRPLCVDQWCSDSCPLEAKHTGTQYLTWFGKSSTSTGEVHIIRDK